MTAIRTSQLNDLLASWERDTADADRPQFHRDGIIDEECYGRQRHRILFVMLEGSARDRGNQHLAGVDLREIYSRGEPRKTLTHNVARWTRALLDGESHELRFPGDDLAKELRRVAVMNLKKVSGGASAAGSPVEEHAWRDRERLREEIRIIEPDVMVACGARPNRVLASVVRDDWSVVVIPHAVWSWNGIVVLPTLHPSHRGSVLSGLTRIMDLAEVAGMRR